MLPKKITLSIDLKATKTIEKTRTRSATFTFQFLWNILNGTPFTANNQDREVSSEEVILKGSSDIGCGNKGLLYKTLEEFEEIENKFDPNNSTHSEYRYRMTKTPGIALKIIGSLDSFNECTGTVTVQSCPPIAVEPCPAVPPGSGTGE